MQKKKLVSECEIPINTPQIFRFAGKESLKKVSLKLIKLECNTLVKLIELTVFALNQQGSIQLYALITVLLFAYMKLAGFIPFYLYLRALTIPSLKERHHLFSIQC